MDNDDFRRMLLGSATSAAPAEPPVSEEPTAPLQVPGGHGESEGGGMGAADAEEEPLRLSWPELVAYDGRMVARAIAHDRLDVRVVTITEEQSGEGEYALLISQQNEQWDDWEARAAPLLEEELHTHELIVLLVVRPCRGARPQDTTVVSPPWVMRRCLLETVATGS
jgi:hypothetical protein